jgi:hypothetical protein
MPPTFLLWLFHIASTGIGVLVLAYGLYCLVFRSRRKFGQSLLTWGLLGGLFLLVVEGGILSGLIWAFEGGELLWVWSPFWSTVWFGTGFAWLGIAGAVVARRRMGNPPGASRWNGPITTP